MKKIIVFSLILLVSLSFIACSSQKYKKYSEGWIDDNTYRVKVIGIPRARLAEQHLRRATSKEYALIMAQKKILNSFFEARIGTECAACHYGPIRKAISKEFSSLVRSGSIIHETYDKDDNCEIVYELKSEGLKNQVYDFDEE